MIISPEQLDDILAHYPKEVHELLINQIGVVSGMMLANQEQYKNDEGFRAALDLMLVNVIKGKFLPIGVKPIE